MTNTRRTKRNINKELMFSKIMPTYSTSTFNEYYQNGTEARGPRGSEPDTFKIREKVLDALKDRVPMQDDEIDLARDQIAQPETGQDGVHFLAVDVQSFEHDGFFLRFKQ